MPSEAPARQQTRRLKQKRRSYLMRYSKKTEVQAQRFAQAYREGRPASMPAMRFSDWPCFMATVRKLQGGQA